MGAAHQDPPGEPRPDGDESDRGRASAAERLAELESRLEEMVRAHKRLEARLAALEEHPAPQREAAASPLPASGREPASRRPPASGPRPAPERVSAPARKPSAPSALPEGFGGWAAVAGRLFLILGGAYLLRALAESGTLSFTVGVGLAACYALFWLGLAHRTSRSASTVDRTTHGLAFVLVAFPLVVENTNHFHLFSPPVGAVLLGVAALVGLGVAWKHSLRALGWILLAGAFPAASVAALHTQAWAPFMLLFVVVGIAVDWVSLHRTWLPIRILAAGATDLALLLYLPVVLVDRDHYTPRVTLVQLSLFIAYMGSYTIGSFARKRSLGTFERVQLGAVLLIGYVGAVLGSLHVSGVSVPLAWASVAAGVAGFGLAYVLFVLPFKSSVDSWFNTSYALAGVLVGTWVLLPEPAYAWIGIAVLLTLAGTQDAHGCLPVHGTVFAVFAAAGSGLLAQVGYAFAGDAASSWPALSLPALAALAALALAYFAPLESEAVRCLLPARVAKTVSLAVLLAGLDAVVVTLAVPRGDGGLPPEWLAALRTGLIAGSALLLAALSRTDRFREARALVYPLLVFGGIKIVLEDLQHGRAVTLFVAFLLYGAALIAAPRLRRRMAAAR